MEIRNKLQMEAVEKYQNRGIFLLAPRFGKIKTVFDLCNKKGWKNIKVIAPRTDIFEGWKIDKEKFNFNGNLTFSTTVGIKKEEVDNYDLVVADEIHEYSTDELKALKKIIGSNQCIGLTGTATHKTKEKIYQLVGMQVCHQYSIKQAVADGILTDYKIFIHNVKLDNKYPYISTKKGLVTENQRFNQLTWLKNKLENEEKSTFFIDLKIISLLQNSIAKIQKTKELLNSNERILVFCGTTETADKLGIDVYHSKSKEKQIFDSFCKGGGNKHLATIKMMQAGITILPINKGIINYMSGKPEDAAQKICRFLGYEYNNINKKAEIHVICSNTEFEQDRLKTALMFFEEGKIKQLN